MLSVCAVFLVSVQVTYAQLNIAKTDSPSLLLQSTTSTQNSGLYAHILPRFTEQTGIEIRVVAVGTGQALKNAQNCDADLVLVHAKEAEEAFIRAGYGVERHTVMVNDFVLIGPAKDPSNVRLAESVTEALSRIANGTAPFISRGDDSGTHTKERHLWKQAGIAPDPKKPWYREVGAGMGAALNITISLRGYSLSDRATWLTFKNKSDHSILFDADPALSNTYSVIAVNPDHCPKADAKHSARFIQWLLSASGRAAITSHKVNGKQLFFPIPQ